MTGSRGGSTHARGRAGEERAVAYLRDAGYRILARNFRSRRGEVDIVAEHRGNLVCVEVKSWAGLAAGELERAIGVEKQRRIIDATRTFIARNPEAGALSVRFDVILIRSGEIHHIRGAFDA